MPADGGRAAATRRPGRSGGRGGPGGPGRAAGAARLFLAVWPDPAARQALLRWRDGARWPAGAAATPPEQLHLTLHFIGDVPLARLPEVAEGLAVPCRRCWIGFDRAEHWGCGLAVLGAATVPPALAELHGRLAEALRALGLPVERRPWRPHVTLARRAAGAVLPPGGPGADWAVDGYALVQSAGGYRTLRRYAAA